MRRLTRGQRLLLLGILLVVIDQVIKILVKTNMPLYETIDVFNWFKIRFIENKGFAFGMSFGGLWGKILLSLFRIALSFVLIRWIITLLKRDGVPIGVTVGLTLIASGAIGNLIDCLCYGWLFSASTPDAVSQWGGYYAAPLLGQVVDMFYFPLFKWPDWVPYIGGDTFFEPVFNFADSCVSVGAVYLILFQWRFFAPKEDKKANKLPDDEA